MLLPREICIFSNVLWQIISDVKFYYQHFNFGINFCKKVFIFLPFLNKLPQLKRVLSIYKALVGKEESAGAVICVCSVNVF